ncbi:valine--tRNA ligase [Condylostylus longicornis]|uniref:valine--tRNA ligase n=1 Tax=Condylostylus longicornis TaxID=2530218 RepID=UPI00244D9E55|nr:valine--tRNA ligase [Condylostylus longicornis]
MPESTGKNDMENSSSASAPDSSNQPVKTAKQLEKEAKKAAEKAAKLAKLQQKLEKKAASQPAIKEKEKPEKKQKEVTIYVADTAPGDKKDTTGPLPDSYSPQYVEAAWYSWWEKEGFFKPEYNKRPVLEENPKGRFVMVIPPPNVTGSLHLGHALTNAVEDCITRFHRMKGRTTLWVPGCDHAGIATQVVVEKMIWREKKLTRHDLGREKFIEKVWEWKNQKGHRIYDQLKRMGSSYDWSRVAFTMDEKLCKAVTEAFVRLHEAGSIYRSSRLVNWSCSLRSAISDIEVDKVDIPGRTLLSIPGYDEKVEFGVLVSFAYKVENSDEEIIVATTRIETMLGDTAVAVHPNDERYSHLRGKYVLHPFCSRRLPIVCDEFVDPGFGTGAVKITPAHDPNDYEVGKRHNLPFITIFNDDGYIIGDYGEFTGMKRFECRKKLLKKLQELQLYKETIDNPMVVPICSRSKDVVEPLIKPQWYVKCADMAASATKAVQDEELKIIPEHHKKTWFHWMDGIRDWCVSRQLWWGHRIPAYFVSFTDTNIKCEIDDEKYWIVARSSEEALEKASQRFNVDKSKIQLKQDEDVLDTWFSSGLFPFSVFGWPNDTDDLKAFYPTVLLETGHDILFFWVARMVFMGQKLLGKLPFKEVYLHPIVRDAHGRKMSKSLGNVIDPMDVITGITLEDLHAQLYNSNLDPREIERAKAGQKQDYPNGIPECGTDALRFALCAYITQGRDINLDILRVQGYRFFCNKLWNATKFALHYFVGDEKFEPKIKLSGKENTMDIWILSRLANAVECCNKSFENYDFASATTACYNFWLYDLCDVYLECVKPIFQTGNDEEKEESRKVLYTCLDFGLKLISPFMPFITEELYQRLPRKETTPSICVASYPEFDVCPWYNEDVEKDVEFMQKAASRIRSARSDYNIPNKTKTEAYVVCTVEQPNNVLKKYKNDLATISFCSNIKFDEKPPIGCAIITVSGQCEVHLLLKGLIEVEKELAKLGKKKLFLEQTVEKLGKVMGAEDYLIKVPPEIQISNNEKLEQTASEILRITSAMDTLKLM